MEWDDYRAFLARNLDHERRRLAEKARGIERIVAALAAQLEDETRNVIVSEIGELQGQATMFDAQCASYASAKETLKNFDEFRGAIES